MRWTDAQVRIALAVAWELGRLQEQHRIATAVADVETTWIPIDLPAWREHREALREAEEAAARGREDEARKRGEFVWPGVENMSAVARRAAYRRLLDSWEE